MRRLLLPALAAITLTAQTPKDVDGWNRIKWTMTLAQAQTAYAADLSQVRIGDLPMPATLETADTGRVKEVKLTLALSTFIGRTNAVQTLTDLLIQKYGLPAHRDPLQTHLGIPTDTSVTWIFPSTIISLDRFESKSGILGFVELRYTATDKQALGVL